MASTEGFKKWNGPWKRVSFRLNREKYKNLRGCEEGSVERVSLEALVGAGEWGS